MGLLDSILSKGQGHKEVIGIAVTPNLGLEVAIIDKASKTVKNYGRKTIKYDISRREITDVGEFKNALGALISQMDIGQNSLAYLVLPNVYFDFIELGAETTKPEEIRTAILSEAEEFFIFKREEPVSGYCEVVNPNSVERKKYVYSSFQREHIENLKSAVEECGLKLIGIETSYTATIRGLYTAKKEEIDELVLQQAQWALMLVNTNSFVMFKMEGKDLIGYLEVPLAVRAYSIEESYEAIISNASQILDDYQSSKLYILSQVEEISAEIIKRKMRFNNDIESIECNNYASSNQLMEVKAALDYNDTNSMTAAVIGATNLSSDFGLILNILQNDVGSSLGVYFTANILGKKVDITSSLVTTLGVVIIVILLIIYAPVYFVVSGYDKMNKDKVSEIDAKIQEIDRQIEEASKDGDKEEVNINMEIDKVAESNVAAINFYDSIATDIPKDVWLTAYYNKNGTQLAIRGIAENIADVYEYYKSLKIVSPESDIKLSELKVFANDGQNKEGENQEGNSASKIASGLLLEESDRLYSFEISNTQMNEGGGINPSGNETEIISRQGSTQENNGEINVEEVSQQMKPLRKRKAKHGKATQG